MNQQDKTDEGILQAIMVRLEKTRLPRLLELKEKVDQGKRLNSFDIEFLERVVEGAEDNAARIERHPEYHELVRRLAHLYHEITEKALQNEKGEGTPPAGE